MSNPMAIAAVTATVRNLLTKVATPFTGETDTDLSDTQVTTLPPDKAGLTDDHNQINVFLYHVLPNAFSRNLDGSGQIGKPPGLALNLLYMITVYGRSSSDIFAHRLLGRAMSLLHSYAILSPSDIAAALPGNDLGSAIDRVRLIPHEVTNEEMMRLWGCFQVKYRLSVLYRAAAVLIDNEVVTPTAPAVQSINLSYSPSVPATSTSSSSTSSSSGSGSTSSSSTSGTGSGSGSSTTGSGTSSTSSSSGGGTTSP